MAVRAVGSQENLFSSPSQANRTRAMRHKLGRLADCGALEAPFNCQNAHHGPDPTAAAYLHNQERIVDIGTFGREPCLGEATTHPRVASLSGLPKNMT
jgi:hypothetical protein